MKAKILNEQTVLEAENQLLKAMEKSDIETLNELLHDDLSFILPTGQVITKSMDMETHKSGNLILEEIVSAVDSIKLIGDNAVATLTSKIKGKMLQQSFEGQFRYIRVWKIVDEKLKVIAGSCVSLD